MTAIVIDLVSLIEQHAGVRLAKKANSSKDGPEYWGNCPFCKTGDNRFHVWPLAQRPHFWCRICLSSGDHIQFLREYEGLSFSDACLELGIEPSELVASWQASPPAERNEQPPSKQWQEAARSFIARAERYLWLPNAPKAVEALAYLRARGLADETIRQAHLGYCPLGKDGRWYFDSFEHWGIDSAQLREDQRAKGGVRIPDGIVIPWTEGSVVWKIAVKRPGEKLDYGQVLGSGEGLYNVDSIEYGKPCMMVEGEIDTLSVQQEAGDLIAVVATGSTTRGRLMRWNADLAMASIVLQSFDEDAAGDQGAEYWLETLKHSMRWSPAVCKDPNEMLQLQNKPDAIVTLRAWVEYGIQAATIPTPTPARNEEQPQEEPTTDPALPAMKPEYQHAIDTQAEYERLSASHRVSTPQGPGTIWGRDQLRAHIERNQIRVVLDRYYRRPGGSTELFQCKELEPIGTSELMLSF